MNFDEPEDVRVLIIEKLKEIEKKEHIKILHAIESGSRAWGLASPDSDYDVRFVYIRPMNDYLKLEAQKDFIDWELNEVLDINGWDITKAFRHIHKSNAVMFEWCNSPSIYYTTAEWSSLYPIFESYFSCKSSMYHYYGTANKNFREYLTEDTVKYKKYFYVLRPILACKWIEENQCPPPVLFDELKQSVLEPAMKPIIEELIQKKVQMAESEKGERIEAVNQYIANKLEYYKETIEQMADDRNIDWHRLNQEFLSLLQAKCEINDD